MSHDIEVVSAWSENGWHAECSCGWRSETQRNSTAALRAGSDHRASEQGRDSKGETT